MHRLLGNNVRTKRGGNSNLSNLYSVRFPCTCSYWKLRPVCLASMFGKTTAWRPQKVSEGNAAWVCVAQSATRCGAERAEFHYGANIIKGKVTCVRCKHGVHRVFKGCRHSYAGRATSCDINYHFQPSLDIAVNQETGCRWDLWLAALGHYAVQPHKTISGEELLPSV